MFLLLQWKLRKQQPSQVSISTFVFDYYGFHSQTPLKLLMDNERERYTN